MPFRGFQLKSPQPYGYVFCSFGAELELSAVEQRQDGKLRFCESSWPHKPSELTREGKLSRYPEAELRLFVAIMTELDPGIYPRDYDPRIHITWPTELPPAEVRKWEPKLENLRTEEDNEFILLGIQLRDRYEDYYHESSSGGIKVVREIDESTGKKKKGIYLKIDPNRYPRPFRGVGSPYRALHEYYTACKEPPFSKIFNLLMERMYTRPNISSSLVGDFRVMFRRMVIRWWRFRDLEDKGIEWLNKAERELAKEKAALEEFYYSILVSFVAELVKNKVVTRCAFCDEIIRYRESKKYCSPLAEGRDCGKKARSKKYYEQHKGRLRPYYHQEMKETRKLDKKVLKKATDPTENPAS